MSHRYPTRFQANATQSTQATQPKETPAAQPQADAIQQEAKPAPPQTLNDIVRFMLDRIDKSPDIADKVSVSIKLFEYLLNHPISFTPSPLFKNTVWDKMYDLDDEVASALYHIPSTYEPHVREIRTNAIYLLDIIRRVREIYYY
jgi:hypothetical protein